MDNFSGPETGFQLSKHVLTKWLKYECPIRPHPRIYTILLFKWGHPRDNKIKQNNLLDVAFVII